MSQDKRSVANLVVSCLDVLLLRGIHAKARSREINDPVLIEKLERINVAVKDAKSYLSSKLEIK